MSSRPCFDGKSVEYLSNDVIGIVVHTSRDALHCQDYASKARDYSSRPTLVMNRNLFLPYHKANAEFEEEKTKGADMDIENLGKVGY